MRVDASKVVLWLTGIFVLIQVVMPAKTNPESDPSQSLRVVKADHAAAIAAMDRSCRDCHSNDTIWPWYSYVAPVSWLVSHGVNEGRRELNMSEFGTIPRRRSNTSWKKPASR